MALTKFTRISNWLRENWRTLAFLAYIVICIFDFIVMPIIYQYFNTSLDPAVITQLAGQYKDPNVQIQFLKLYGAKQAWLPVTLGANGAFHFSFGTLLTAAGWTRGQEKIACINKGIGVTPDNPDQR